jgi:hypothetical protein
VNIEPIPVRAAKPTPSNAAQGRVPSSWAAEWLDDIAGLAPVVARLVGESPEATARALHQAAAVVLARVASLSQSPAGGARLLRMLRLPGADASVVPDLDVVLDDERESETLMKAGAEALGGLFGAHRIAPLAGAIAVASALRHRNVSAHVLELVAAIALARINVVAKERRLDTRALMTLLAESGAETSRAVAPEVAATISDERKEASVDLPSVDRDSAVFHAPPPPSTRERVLAWSVLGASLSALVYAAFVL